MIEKSKVKQAIDGISTVLLQKNARCPICAGSIHTTYNRFFDMMVYKCNDCHYIFKPRDEGLTDEELICDILRP